MKILLFGKNGQVGWELNQSLQPLGEIVVLDIEKVLGVDLGDYLIPAICGNNDKGFCNLSNKVTK